MTVHLYETFKLPISDAITDFNLASSNGGTAIAGHCRYTRNRPSGWRRARRPSNSGRVSADWP
ncbi:MAG: hypothetical protein WCC01_11175 [Acidimicrobiia bacterium]